MTMMMVRIMIMMMMTAIEAVVVVAVTGHQTGQVHTPVSLGRFSVDRFVTAFPLAVEKLSDS